MNKDYKDFGLEVISKGSFVDSGVNIETTVIRLNGVAMNEWILSSLLNCREVYNTDEEWETYKAEKQKARADWEKKVAKKLNIEKRDTDGFSITQSVSEIFTVVYMERLEKFYFTFGSDPGFPYQNTYLVVNAENEREAIEKFRKVHPDRHENVFNAALVYSASHWEGGTKQYYSGDPAEIIE